jgi:putative peptide zinc metalloprotease protein
MTAITPIVAEAVVIDPPHDAHSVVRHSVSNRYFRLGEREAAFLASLDGSLSIDELKAESRLGFTPEQIDKLTGWFESQGLLETDAPAEEALRASWLKRLASGVVYSDRWRVTLFRPDPLLDRYRRVVDAFFSKPAVLAYLVIFLLPVFTIAASPHRLSAGYQAFHPMLSIQGWIVLYVSMLAINFCHEMAHATACKHFGGRVERVGLMFMYLQPVAFCDVSDAWRFTSTAQKVLVSAAGIFFQLLVTFVALEAWLYSASPLIGYLALINTVIAMMNLFPFVKLDGYWMIAHLSGQPNLRQKSLQSVDNMVRRLFGFGRAPAAGNGALTAFGIAHLIALPAFWIMGLSAIHRLAAKWSPAFAWAACVLLTAALVYRLGRSAVGYAASLRG